MDAFGLPTSFGKGHPEEPVAGPSSSRGGASGRGERGVVGGGKRNKRGRGRGGETNVGDRSVDIATATTTNPMTANPQPTSGWDRDRATAGLASQYDAFNGGVKRPHNSDHARQSAYDHHAVPMGHYSGSEARGRGGGHRGRGRGGFSDRGGGGGGGARGGLSGQDGAGGGAGGRKHDTFHGRFLKSSMWEDPWIEILKSRQAGKT